MKRIELGFGAILLPLDYLMFLLAAITAYFLRFEEHVSDLRPAVYIMPFWDYLYIILITSAVMIFIFILSGLYHMEGTRMITRELRKIFLACSTGVMLVIIFFFFERDAFSSRFIILAAWGFSLLYVSLARILIIILQRYLFTRGVGVHRVVLIGNDRIAQIIKHTLERHKKIGYHIIEYYPDFNLEIAEKLEKIMKVKPFDEIIQADPNFSKTKNSEILEFCEANHLDFKYAADLFEAQSSRVEIRPLAGIPIIEIKKTPLDGWGKIIKRIIDIIFSLLFIIVTGPLMLLVAVLVKLDSRGPVIYKNERVGENGRKFNTYKFRSMKCEFCTGQQFSHNAEALAFEAELIKEKSIKQGPIYKIKDDPRVTRIGKILRKTSLDEFPQAFNVLNGSMSWVGPRPHQPREVEKYDKQHHKVLNIRPGITGLAQISGRSDLSFTEEVRLDMYYIENWSLWLDAYCLFKTPLILFRKRQAL